MARIPKISLERAHQLLDGDPSLSLITISKERFVGRPKQEVAQMLEIEVIARIQSVETK